MPIDRAPAACVTISLSLTAEEGVDSGKQPQRPDELEASRLRAELVATREYLQALVSELEAKNEELSAANEEVISSNEELQSTNEELQTAQEELQATNEELSTVNEELRHRNLESTQLASDLNNLLSSISIPVLMLGADLQIRRYTPTAARVLNLIPGDIGRPLGPIS